MSASEAARETVAVARGPLLAQNHYRWEGETMVQSGIIAGLRCAGQDRRGASSTVMGCVQQQQHHVVFGILAAGQARSPVPCGACHCNSRSKAPLCRRLAAARRQHRNVEGTAGGVWLVWLPHLPTNLRVPSFTRLDRRGACARVSCRPCADCLHPPSDIVSCAFLPCPRCWEIAKGRSECRGRGLQVLHTRRRRGIARRGRGVR